MNSTVSSDQVFALCSNQFQQRCASSFTLVFLSLPQNGFSCLIPLTLPHNERHDIKSRISQSGVYATLDVCDEAMFSGVPPYGVVRYLYLIANQLSSSRTQFAVWQKLLYVVYQKYQSGRAGGRKYVH